MSATDSPSLKPEMSPEFIQDLAFAAIAPTTEFTKWKARDNTAVHVLWLTGGPGTGKSTVLQGVARNIGTVEKGSEKLHVAAFLCNTAGDRPGNAAAIVQCLLFQVLHQQPGFKNLFDQACSARNQQAFDKPEDIGTISEVFRAIVSGETFARTCFILGALDECCNDGGEEESTQAFEALLDLVATTSQLPSSKAMWLLSMDTQQWMNRMSRRTGDGGQMIPFHLSLDPRPSARPLLLDAATEHAKLRISALRTMTRPGAETSFYEDVERKMIHQSAANFLWVDLAAREIESHGLPWNALRFLDAEAFPAEVLPGTVPELYKHMERCTKNLKWDTPLYCLEILETMAAAFKSLSIRELEEFTAANIPPIVDLETIVEKQCFHFLRIRDRRVRFVHQSAKSFFREKIREEPRRHAWLTRACLQTLSRRLSTSANWSSQGTKPSVITEGGRAYANWYWLKHFLELLRSTDLPEEEWVETLGCVSRFLRDHLLEWLETLAVSPGLAQALSKLGEVDKKLRVCMLLSRLDRSAHADHYCFGKTTHAKPNTDALVQQSCFGEILTGNRFLLFHQSTLSPPEVLLRNSLLFCPDLGKRRHELLKSHFPWLASLPAVEVGRSLVLDGHTDYVRCCAYSPDGDILASGSDDFTVRLWNPRTGELKTTLRGFATWPRRIRFSAGTPTWLAVMERKSIKMWNLSATKPFLELKASDISSDLAGKTFFDISFSPDGKRLAAVLKGPRLAIWDMETSQKQPIYDWSPGPAQRVQYLSTSRRQVSSTEGPREIQGLVATSQGAIGCVLIWKEDGTLFQELEDVGRDVNGLDFCPQTKVLAGGADDGKIRLWRVDPDDDENKPDPKPFCQLQELDQNLICSISLSSDGKYVASTSTDYTLRIWRTEEGPSEEPVKRLKGHIRDPLCISFSPADSSLASCDEAGAVRVWKALSDSPEAEMTQEKAASAVMHTQNVQMIAASPDGTTVASYAWDRSHGTIIFWGGETGQPLHSVKCNRGPLSMVFSHDATLLVATFSDGTFIVWDVKSGTVMRHFSGHDAYARGATFSPPSIARRFIVSASDDHEVRIWDLDASPEEKNDSEQRGVAPTARYRRGSNDWSSSSSSQNGEDIAGLVQILKGHWDFVFCVAFSRNGKFIASAGEDSTILIWEWDSTKPQELAAVKKELLFPSYRIRSVAFSPSGQRLVASAEVRDSARDFRLFDTETGKCVWAATVGYAFKSLRFGMDPAGAADENWVLTETGRLFLGEPTINIPEPPPDWAPWSIDSDRSWIRYRNEKAIYLPKRFRPAAGAVFIQGSMVAIGCPSGLVMLLRFKEDAESKRQLDDTFVRC